MLKAIAKSTSRVRKPEVRLPNYVDPNTLPDCYGMQVNGVCLDPDIPHGAYVECRRDLPYAPGDWVIIHFRPDMLRPGQPSSMVKRLVLAPPPWVRFPYSEHPDSTVRALIVTEQVNPKRSFGIPCAEILAIHRCLGPVAADQCETV